MSSLKHTKEQREEFFTLLAPGTKKIAICQRRVGTRDRMVQIALCTSETMADHIVQGLHLRQKELVKIETSMERELVALKGRIAAEQNYATTAKSALREAEKKLRGVENEFERYTIATQNEYCKLRAELNGFRLKGNV